MLNSELRKMVEDKMIASMERRAPDVIADTFDTLSREYVDYPLVASIFSTASTWVRHDGIAKAHENMRTLSKALDSGVFEVINKDAHVAAIQLQTRYRRAKSEDRVLALRWSAWLSYEMRNTYKVLGRALYGMEAA